jgi:arylsulfatase A
MNRTDAKMNRSTTLFAFAIGLLMSLSVDISAKANEGNKNVEKLPNILILYADDLGFGDLGCYNADSKIPTPNLDQLAKAGMRFTDAHSSSGICTPSRYALLTGRHHWRDFHNIVGAFGKSVFKRERITMPEMLQEKGYYTAAIGKWHLGWDWDAIKVPGAETREFVDHRNRKKKAWGPEAFDWNPPIPDGPLDHGFDHYFGDTVINFPPYCWIEDNKTTSIPDRMVDQSTVRIKEGNVEFRLGPTIEGWDPYENIPTTTKRGVEFIHSQADNENPFFLYFAFPSPHAPIIPNDEFDGKSQAGPYGDLVFETDDACGQLLKALEESGQAENTIVIFSADNGPEHYAYARDEKFGHWSAEPFRGLKRDIYEGGHHVPLIVKWPGVTSPEKVSDALVSQIDIMATLASMVGFELPDDCAEDSHDLLPLMNGRVESVRTTHIHNTYKNKYAIREGDWLLIDHKDGYTSRRDAKWESRHGYPSDDDSPAELYNLKDDIGQRRDLAQAEPAKVIELQTLMAKIREQGYSAPRLSGSDK